MWRKTHQTPPHVQPIVYRCQNNTWISVIHVEGVTETNDKVLKLFFIQLRIPFNPLQICKRKPETPKERIQSTKLKHFTENSPLPRFTKSL